MMTTAIDTFQDILTAIGNNPELRHQLIGALFPDVNIMQTLQELSETNKAIHDRLAHIEQDVDQLKVDVSHLKEDVNQLKIDVAMLKGKSHESDIQRNATGIFGRWIRRGRDGRNDLADAMFEAGMEAEDVDEVLASDYIFSGVQRGGGSTSLIIESSHFAELNDIEQAKKRAELATNAGLQAYPLVTAEIWSAEMIVATDARKVLVVHGKRMRPESWARVVGA